MGTDESMSYLLEVKLESNPQLEDMDFLEKNNNTFKYLLSEVQSGDVLNNALLIYSN